LLAQPLDARLPQLPSRRKTAFEQKNIARIFPESNVAWIRTRWGDDGDKDEEGFLLGAADAAVNQFLQMRFFNYKSIFD